MKFDEVTIAGIIAIIGALTGLIVAVMKALGELRATRVQLQSNSDKLDSNTKTTEDTHDLVNSRMDSMIESNKTLEDNQRSNESFQNLLITHLRLGGIEIPSDAAHPKGVNRADTP